MNRPEKAEYDAYYKRYIDLVEDTNLLDLLAAQPAELNKLLGGFTDERGMHAYTDGKWTIKELFGHIIDGERMFAYRAFRISRGDKTPIEGFEQDGYIENARSNIRSLGEMIEEFRLLRAANLIMLKHLSEEDLLRMGMASGLPVSVRALAHIMAGHVIHHVNILRAQYLV